MRAGTGGDWRAEGTPMPSMPKRGPKREHAADCRGATVVTRAALYLNQQPSKFSYSRLTT